MLYRDTVVEEARSQDTGIRSQELIDCCFKLDLRNQIINWERVAVGHIDIAARKIGHNVGKIRRFEMDTLGKPTLISKGSNHPNFCSRSDQNSIERIEVVIDRNDRRRWKRTEAER